ncbi:tyrosine-type recombinase/integrase [Blastococcus saxobsidens]|uniref:Integrase family protein (Modular protein) n=1 Tax=Blastococcus saxobsidens (strain DD2) TaxID=1146883 RepID=H6RU85_BLASD|nr:tyrosine-type recombinase/integrase [Blastococcus saxobsidens]CCG05692.1 Integrase family protein (modular protein) [Blastococcus saxobsidens DD2]
MTTTISSTRSSAANGTGSRGSRSRRSKLSPAQREAADAARAARIAALHDQIGEQVEALTADPQWRAMLDAAAKFHTYSLGNQLLIGLQAARLGISPTRVAGFGTWKALGRSVLKGSTGLAVLAPCTYTPKKASADLAAPAPGAAGEPSGGDADRPAGARVLRGFRVAHVFDISQTEGDPLPDIVPELLTGDAPAALWDALASQIAGHGYTLTREDCGQANGLSDPAARTVRVRPDVADAQAVKTLAHDLLTAPSRVGERARPVRAQRTRRRGFGCDHPGWLAAALSPPMWGGAAVARAGECDPSRDVTGLTVAAVGGIRVSDELPGVAVLDAAGVPVPAIADYLCSLLASGAATGSVRSYALALLRWWRFLAAVELGWQRASRVEARDFVLWMRLAATTAGGATRAGRVGERVGYAPATINHNLAVLRGFYADRMAAGDGPVVNPVPEAVGRGGQRVGAHANPMAPPERHRRAPLRQKTPARLPRSLPDHLFDTLFAAMRSDRDRALLALYVSTGARASELLGVSVDRVDVGAQRIGVHRKGSGRLQWLPGSADAFVWLRLYQQRQDRPAGQQALWLTRRAPHRPLTYSAMRRVLQRANEELGTGWTLHDLRHTAAFRMAEDPRLTLTDVQWVLGHAQLATTQIYLRPREDAVVARVLEHHRARGDRPARQPAAPPSGGYRPDSLRELLGQARDAR